jgi:hypothetical protein
MLRIFTLKRLSVVIALVSVGVAIGSGAALGFVIQPKSANLSDAIRWSNVPESLVEQGVRGLGGGIEYVIAEDFCVNIIPRFEDEPKPTCDQLKEVIQTSLRQVGCWPSYPQVHRRNWQDPARGSLPKGWRRDRSLRLPAPRGSLDILVVPVRRSYRHQWQSPAGQHLHQRGHHF